MGGAVAYPSTRASPKHLIEHEAKCAGYIVVTVPHLSVVDDDESVREALPDLLRELGFTAEAFPSADSFLASNAASRTSCLLLDIRMPGMSGPDLQRELTRRRQLIPIVFITAHEDEALRPRLIAGGAVDCLLKPFSEATLLAAVTAALRSHRAEPGASTNTER